MSQPWEFRPGDEVEFWNDEDNLLSGTIICPGTIGGCWSVVVDRGVPQVDVPEHVLLRVEP